MLKEGKRNVRGRRSRRGRRRRWREGAGGDREPLTFPRPQPQALLLLVPGPPCEANSYSAAQVLASPRLDLFFGKCLGGCGGLNKWRVGRGDGASRFYWRGSVGGAVAATAGLVFFTRVRGHAMLRSAPQQRGRKPRPGPAIGQRK